MASIASSSTTLPVPPPSVVLPSHHRYRPGMASLPTRPVPASGSVAAAANSTSPAASATDVSHRSAGSSLLASAAAAVRHLVGGRSLPDLKQKQRADASDSDSDADSVDDDFHLFLPKAARPANRGGRAREAPAWQAQHAQALQEGLAAYSLPVPMVSAYCGCKWEDDVGESWQQQAC